MGQNQKKTLSLLLFERFAALVAVILAERGCSAGRASEWISAVHAELSTSGLLVVTGGAGFGRLGLWDGEYEAHRGGLIDGLAERVLLAGQWWWFVPVHFSH